MKRKTSSREAGSVPGASAASPVPETSTGLLRNVAQGPEAERWPDFVARYKPVLEYYLGGLSKADPRLTRDLWDDIEQETFVALLTTLPEGRYDRAKGDFHSWLRGVLRHKAQRALERRGEIAEVPADDAPGAEPDDAPESDPEPAPDPAPEDAPDPGHCEERSDAAIRAPEPEDNPSE